MSEHDGGISGTTADKTDPRRMWIAMARRVVFAGLTVLGAWLLIIEMRKDAAAWFISSMGESFKLGDIVRVTSDWSSSWWTGDPVGEVVSRHIGMPLELAGYGVLMALGIAAVLLVLGVVISRATKSPAWLAKPRTILRVVLVNGFVSNPFVLGIIPVMIGSLAFLGTVPSPSHPPSPGINVGDVFIVSLLPAWLLVQSGHQELKNFTGDAGRVAKHFAITLVIRLLRLAGAVIAVALLAGNTLLRYVLQRDFPVVFAYVFVLAVIVVVAKLLGDLIEVVYTRGGTRQTEAKTASSGAGVPKGWVVFSLVLVAIIVLASVIGPLLAPYGINDVSIAERLAPPSAAHLLGTDNLGRDVLSRILFALRTDVLWALLAVVVVIGAALLWTLLAALARRRKAWLGETLEDVAMLPRDILGAFPWAALLMVLAALLGAGSVALLVLAVGIVLWPHAVSMLKDCYVSARQDRSQIEGLLLGVLPVFILATGGAVLYITTLSYMGLGVPPPRPELGSMLASDGRVYLFQAPWMAQWPISILAILLFVWVMGGNTLLERMGYRTGAVWAKSME